MRNTFIIVLLCIFSSPLSWGQIIKTKNIDYRLNRYDSTLIVVKIKKGGVVEIPAKAKRRKVVGIDKKVKEDDIAQEITELILPPTIYKLERYQFCGLQKLTRIVLPEGITELPECAFMNCTALTDLTLPPSLQTIGISAFERCSKLDSIKIPKSVTTIENGAFKGCENLRSIKIPDNVTNIEDYAFQDCINLTKLYLPRTIENIGKGAFMNCSKLKKVRFPSDFSKFADDAFKNTPAEEYSQEYLTKHWFLQGRGRTVKDGLCYRLNSAEEATVSVSGYNNSGDIVIPDSVNLYGKVYSVVEIEWHAFQRNNITSVIIPRTCTTIKEQAFAECSNLNYVDIPNSVTTIKNAAFSSCSSLASVDIPNSVTSIGEYAFSRTGLQSVSIPASVERIDDYCFYGCKDLAYVTVPNGVKMGRGVFESTLIEKRQKESALAKARDNLIAQYAPQYGTSILYQVISTYERNKYDYKIHKALPIGAPLEFIIAYCKIFYRDDKMFLEYGPKEEFEMAGYKKIVYYDTIAQLYLIFINGILNSKNAYH